MLFSPAISFSTFNSKKQTVLRFPLLVVVLFAALGKVTVKSLSVCVLYRILLQSHKPVSFADVS